MRHQGAGALGQARAHGRLGLRARRGQLERRIKRGKTAENRRKIGQARHIRDTAGWHTCGYSHGSYLPDPRVSRSRDELYPVPLE